MEITTNYDRYYPRTDFRIEGLDSIDGPETRDRILRHAGEYLTDQIRDIAQKLGMAPLGFQSDEANYLISGKNTINQLRRQS
jgi:hypothetical protein